MYVYHVLLCKFYIRCIKIMFFQPQPDFLCDQKVISGAWAALWCWGGSNGHSVIDMLLPVIWILRNSWLVWVASAMEKHSLERCVPSHLFTCWWMAPSTAGCSTGTSSRGIPCFTVAGKRQETCGGAKHSVCKGTCSSHLGVSKALASGDWSGSD